MAFLLHLLACLSLAYGLEFASISPDWSDQYNSSRTTWTGLRLAVHYNDTLPCPYTGQCPEMDLTSLKDQVIPTAVEWFQKLLKVPRLISPLKIPLNYCGQVVVPEAHRTIGIMNVDAVIYIATVPLSIHKYDLKSYGTACLLSDERPNRVVAGTIWLTMDWFSTLTYQKQVDLIARHIAQILGFDPLLFSSFTKADGSYYDRKEIITNDTMAGQEVYLLTLPTVVNKAREAFNCPSLKGVRLEGEDPDDISRKTYAKNYDLFGSNFTSFLSLWSGRMMLNDFMSDLIVADKASYSDVTMALFEDSGWYSVDWKYTSVATYGYKRGCEFFEAHCGSETEWTGFCENGTPACSPDFTLKGECKETCSVFQPFKFTGPLLGGNPAMDFCPIIETGTSCLSGEVEVAWEEKCEDCRCFAGNLNGVETHCHKIKCGDLSAEVTVGNKVIACPPEGGSVAVEGFTDLINCPPFHQLCAPISSPNLCNGQDNCLSCPPGHHVVNGQCEPISRVLIACNETCATCSGPGGSDCLSCYEDALLPESPGRCICKSSTSSQCTPCHPRCLTCRDDDAFYCLECHPYAQVDTLSHTCECEDYAYPAPDSSNCQLCHTTCQSCTGPESNQCVSCNLDIFDKFLNGECVCNPARYYNATEMKCTNCSLYCALCTSSTCASCLPGFTLNTTDFSCLINDGMYWNEGAQAALPCPAHCTHCDLTPSQTLECSACMDTFILQEDATCSCAVGYSIADWTGGKCEQCADSCLTCDGGWYYRSCVTCLEDYRLVSFLVYPHWNWINRCYKCEEGYYQSLNDTCANCTLGCKYCLGPEYNQCTNCFNPLRITGSQECLCPDRHYPNPNVLNCTICHDTCQECNGPSDTNCTSCHSWDVLTNGSCIRVCDPTCENCSHSYHSRACITCKDPSLTPNDGVCECPTVNGKYEVRDDCRCGWECNGCDGQGGCSECYWWWHHRFNQTDHTCICPMRMYPEPDLKHCAYCHPTCEECVGPNITQCTVCASGLTRVSDGTCKCPYGSEWKEDFTTCYTPDFLCKDQFCDQCKDGGLREEMRFATTNIGRCYCEQPESGLGVYLDSMAGTCNLCFPLCTSCARDPQVCSSCIPQTIFTPTTPSSNWGSCTCPRGSYYSAYSREIGGCVPCSTGCLSCLSEITCDACQYGFTLTKEEEGLVYCSCAASLCGCPIGLYELAPMMSCEDFCPTGYLARNRACLESTTVPITFKFDNYTKSFLDTSGRYTAKLGSTSLPTIETDTESPLPMYPGNLYFSGDKQKKITINSARGQDTLVLAPTFYIEFWERGDSLISATRPGSFRFSSSSTSIFLVAKNSTNQTFEWTYSPLSVKDWSLVRYEVVVFSKTQTRIHIYLNNTSVFSQTVMGFFFRDSVLFNMTAELLAFESNDTEAYMGPLVISNSIWKQAICQAGGKDCLLAECGYKQYRGENGVCSVCQENCFYGCVQASDCRLPFDMHCLNFDHNLICETCIDNAEVTNGKCACEPPYRLESNSCWEDPLCMTFQPSTSNCTDCKEVAQLDITGTCQCVVNSTYNEANKTCSCFPHYAYNGTACLFDPDHLCVSEEIYTSCPLCKLRSTLQDDGTCTCIGNSTFSANEQECICKERFEQTESECVFIEYPMCLKYGEAYNCEECDVLSYVNQGNCSCIANAQYVEDLCECNPHFEQNIAICDHIEDPLCEEYEENGLCAHCKVHSELLDSIFCECSARSHLSDTGDSCICDSHYVDNNETCVFDVDPICQSTGEFATCPQCQPFASLDDETGYCICQGNREFSPIQSQCVCKAHYSLEGEECTYDPDPVCVVPEAINCYTCRRSRGIEIVDALCSVTSELNGCQECVELARLKKGSCRCVNAAQYVNSSCICAPGYFPDSNLCIPEIDLLCLNETATPCLDCKELSTQVDGICQCTPHSRYNTTTHSCACLQKYASFNNTCFDSAEDPLCLAYDLDKQCISCKEKARPIAGVCSCVDGANFLAPTATCKCRNRYTPTPDDCIFQGNPLCAKYVSDQCTLCTPLSSINATGECSCVKNAVLPVSGGNCMCDFHYRPSGNTCLFDPDPLCKAYVNTTKCTACKTNSQLNSTSGYCNCSDSFLYSSSLEYCEACNKYYSPSEVSAAFGEGFNSLIITLSSSLVVQSQCQDLFEATIWAKFGLYPTCTWESKKITVNFGPEALISEGVIKLISANLIKQSGPCVLPTQLQPLAKYSGNMVPFKSCPITAPSTVPLMCSQSNIDISAENSLGGLGVIEYQWTLSHSFQGSIMPQYRVWNPALAHLTLISTDLMGGVLHVEVKLRDRMNQTCDNKFDITLEENAYLPIRFDLGLSINFTSQDQGEVRAAVTDTCGASGLKRYVWSFVGAEPPLPTNDRRPYDILGISKVPYALAIPRNSLGAGYSYTYGVEVTQGKLSGTANLTLYAQQSPLNIRLNRIGGKHPNDMALSLSTILSTDPDNLPGSISTQWSCVGTDGLRCKSSNGGTLLTQAMTTATSFSISPDMLQLDANYTFTATITKGSRVASQSLSLLIVPTVGCNMELAPIFKVCNTNKYFFIAPVIRTLLEIQFRWTQTSTHSTEPCTTPTASFLAFNPNSLTDASFYHYELKASTPEGTMSMKVDFYVNGNPKGGRAEITPVSGTAIMDRFRITTTGWSDYEENYPLSYQFCCIDTDAKEICITGLSFESYSLRKLYWGCVRIIVKAVDMVGGESQTSASVEVLPFSYANRALEAFSLTSSFLEDVEDPENTFSMVSTYSLSVPVDQSLYLAMISALQKHTETLFQVTPQVLAAALGAQRSLARQNITKEGNNGGQLLQLLNQTLAEYTEEITNGQLFQIFEIALAAGYLNRTLYNTVIETAIDQYYSEKLPSSTGFHFSKSDYEYFTLRQVNALYSSLSLQHATISLPSGWLNSNQVLPTDILDLHVAVNATRNSTEMSMFVRKSGTYLNYNVQLGSVEALTLINATAVYNVSLTHYLGNQTLECLGLDSHNNWTSTLCSVLSVSNTTVSVSTTSLTSFLVRPAHISPQPPNPPDPTAPISSSDTDDSVNPAPVLITFVIFIGGIVAYEAFRRANKKKYQIMTEAHVKESPRYAETNPAPEQDTVRGYEQIIETPQFKPDTKPAGKFESSGVISQSTSHNYVYDMINPRRELHMILGIPSRPEMAGELVCTLLTDILILGVCYTSWLEGEQTASNADEVFSHYSGEDVKFVAVAVACGTVLSLFSLLRKRVIALCSAVISVLELGAVLYLNVEAGYEEGGRWAISVLIALGVQSLLETLKCLVATKRAKAVIAKGVNS